MGRHKYLLVTVIICLIMGFQCGDDYPPEPEPAHIFKEELGLVPAKKGYSISDTIWVETQISGNNLYEITSGQRTPVDSVSLPLSLGYSVLYQAPFNPAGGFCKVVSSNAVEVENRERGTAILASTACNQSNYNLKVGIIPLTTGVYSLSIGSPNF